MNCYLCKSTVFNIINKGVRDDVDVDVLECGDCGLVYLSNINNHKEELYANDPMLNSSSKLYSYAGNSDVIKRFNEHSGSMVNKNVLDFGCGNGSFLKKLKEEKIAASLHAIEPNKKHIDFLNYEFLWHKSIEEIENNSLDIITMFHVLEHLPDPLAILNRLKSKLKSGGKIIIEVPSSTDALVTLYDNSAFKKYTYWSLHLYLFNQNTLARLFDKIDLTTVYIRQYQRYTIANHLHWLSEDKPGGHEIWSYLDDEMLNHLYASKLAQLEKCDSLIAVLQK